MENAEDLIAELSVKGAQDAAQVLGEKVEVLAEFMNKLRTQMAENSSLKKDELTESLIEEFELTIEQGLAHKTGTQEAIQEAKLKKLGHIG